MIRPFCCIALLMTVTASGEPLHWYKGNTHTHTLWSDGNDFPDMVTDWYVKHGYNFLGLSDHNILQAKEVWMAEAAVEKRRKTLGKTTMEKYRALFEIVHPRRHHFLEVASQCFLSKPDGNGLDSARGMEDSLKSFDSIKAGTSLA